MPLSLRALCVFVVHNVLPIFDFSLREGPRPSGVWGLGSAVWEMGLAHDFFAAKDRTEHRREYHPVFFVFSAFFVVNDLATPS